MNFDELIITATARLTTLENEMAESAAVTTPARLKVLAREHRRLKDVTGLWTEITRLRKDVSELETALQDPELAFLAEEELPVKRDQLVKSEQRLKRLIVPEDPADSRNAVVEIRAGTGGEEAALFGGNLYKMYTRYFDRQGWKTQLISGHFSDLGGVREILLNVSGDGVYGELRLESGVHRVQRVPTTETSGRIHTSAATVAVLPEADEVDVEIRDIDLRIDTFRSSGPGGQHVNKTESAVRITHLPTGIAVSCQDEKSQLKNRAHAMKVLRARLFQLKIDEEDARRSAERRSQITTGDRSAKIRTYNFPQNRVTDHRVPVTVYRLDEVLEGDLGQILNPVVEFFADKKLESALEWAGTSMGKM